LSTDESAGLRLHRWGVHLWDGRRSDLRIARPGWAFDRGV